MIFMCFISQVYRQNTAPKYLPVPGTVPGHLPVLNALKHCWCWDLPWPGRISQCLDTPTQNPNLPREGENRLQHELQFLISDKIPITPPTLPSTPSPAAHTAVVSH